MLVSLSSVTVPVDKAVTHCSSPVEGPFAALGDATKYWPSVAQVAITDVSGRVGLGVLLSAQSILCLDQETKHVHVSMISRALFPSPNFVS
jgi:hypothetical protein